MSELAKWAWVVFFAVLFLGYWFFVLIGVEVIILLLIAWLKPEWLESH